MDDQHIGRIAGDRAKAGTESWIELRRDEAVRGRQAVDGERASKSGLNL